MNELIDRLHYFSTFIQNIVLVNKKVQSLIYIDNEVLCEEFLERDNLLYQKQLLESNPQLITLILQNLSNAIVNKCGNVIDVTEFSKNDDFDYNCIINEDEGSIVKHYIITELVPKDEKLFKKLWLYHFIQSLKNVDSIIREILSLNQWEAKPASFENEMDKADFINNFDHVSSNIIYNHFYEGLVKSGYMSEPDLHKYLTAAFELKESPKVLFKISRKTSKQRIYNVFYKYYKDESGKHQGTQKKYVALLGDFFEGYNNKIISTNWSK
ncbi:MAG: hypothetical protein ACI9JN_002481 [Bacteroidia bacterium]|jgi:hypothetical protein